MLRRQLVAALLLALFAASTPISAAVADDVGDPAQERGGDPAGTQAAPPAEQPELVSQLIVKPAPGVGIARSRGRAAQLAGRATRLGATAGGGYRVVELDEAVDRDEAERIAAQLVAEGLAEVAEPERVVTIATGPDDPRYGEQWNLHGRPPTWPTAGSLPTQAIDVEAAWSTTTGSEQVVVAVLDTGKLDHPDLVDRLVPGYDMISNPFTARDGDGRDPDPTDEGDWHTDGECPGMPAKNSSWHGLHVAGIIGATTDNGVGIAGIDHEARILPVRVLGRCGGSIADLAAGIRWAAGLTVDGVPANPNPARVINLSLGAPDDCPTSVQSAITAARSAGAVVVAAAGNTAEDAKWTFPANCAGVLTVAATSVIGDRAAYSNHGSVVDVAAPGGDSFFGPGSTILSTFNAGTTTPDLSEDGWTYEWQQGTSMAAPHVAGVAALTLAANPALTPTQVRNVVRGSARPFPDGPGYDPAYLCTSNPSHPTRTYCGRGIADAGRAVAAATSAPSAPVLTATPGVRQVTLSWTAVSHPAGVSYDLYRTTSATCSTSSTRIVSGTTSRSHTSTGLTAGTTYRFCVRAVAGNGEPSALSNTATAVPLPPAPSWPSDARLGFDLATGGVRLTWPAAKGTVDGYDVYRNGTKVTSTSGRSATVTGLRNGTRYRLDVRARNAGGASAALTRWVTPTSGFRDVSSSSVFHTDIRWLATGEITLGCNPPSNDRFCPGDAVTRAQMASFLTRALDLKVPTTNRFRDVSSSNVHRGAINALAQAGITQGCNPPRNDRFCPNDPVTRAQMGSFLARALDLPLSTRNAFTDVSSGNVHRGAINALAEAGITQGCAPRRYCPNNPVTRGQMAAFVRRALTR